MLDTARRHLHRGDGGAALGLVTHGLDRLPQEGFYAGPVRRTDPRLDAPRIARNDEGANQRARLHESFCEHGADE